jgi:chaperonin GroES
MQRLRESAAEALLASDDLSTEARDLAQKILDATKAQPRFEPLNDGVLVTVQLPEERTKGGIILPDIAKKPMNQGIVEAVGPGRMLENGSRVPTTVKRGQIILFGMYSGTKVVVDGTEYTLMREIDVLGIVHGKLTSATLTHGGELPTPPIPTEPPPPTIAPPTDAEIEKAVADLVGEPMSEAPALVLPGEESKPEVAPVLVLPGGAPTEPQTEPAKVVRSLDAL